MCAKKFAIRIDLGNKTLRTLEHYENQHMEKMRIKEMNSISIIQMAQFAVPYNIVKGILGP